jgi:hypothetical protein
MLSLVHHINPHSRLSTASSVADSAAYDLENLLIHAGFEEKHRQLERMAKAFSELSEREILALAISLEEDDARIYGDYADRLEADYPDTAKMLKIMQDEELGACPEAQD